MAIVNVLGDNLWLPVALLAAAYVVEKLWAYNRLRQFKGPFGSGFFGFYFSWVSLSGRSHEYYAKLNEKYGPIVRIAPNFLVTSSPDFWMRVNAVRSPYKRSEWYYNAVRIEPGKDNVFSETNDAIHKDRRVMMTAGYSGKENLSLEPDIDECIKDFIHLIRSKYISTSTQSRPMDFAQKVPFLTLDVISSVAATQKLGMLQADSDINGYVKGATDGLQIVQFSLALGLGKLMGNAWLGKRLGPSPKDKSGWGKLQAVAHNLVDKREKLPTDTRSDMIGSFIRHGLTGEALKSEVCEQIVAGSDTTAGSIRATFLHLMTNPRVYRKLQDEIDATVRDGKASPLPGIVPDKVVRQLPYLQAVIREGWRMWPPVPGYFPKRTPPEGDTIVVDGVSVFVPGGVDIGISPMGIHHSKKVFGDDVKVFRPERWLTDDKERLDAMIRVNDLTFGHGKWQCLGKPVAEIEISKTIFELFRNFDWGLINPDKPWEAKNFSGLYCIFDMWVTASERILQD